ncbi:uncharacterized protein [Primulina huaijiensis]|uniref:uncharacterized protein n=1 Tax=Primulina huaijiensis TaxID=1492673 RepID=UPI003CC746F9
MAILSSCLPTLKALQSRSVAVTECCSLCHNKIEDDFHGLATHASAGCLISVQFGLRQRKKPPDNVIKCNVDAAVFESSWRFDYGCIARNYQGVVIDASYGTLPGQFSPTIVETLSIREALSWIKTLDCPDIIIESDVLLVIEVLNSSKLDYTSLSLIVRYCNLLVREFSICQFDFVFRLANQATHTLARKAASMSDLV